MSMGNEPIDDALYRRLGEELMKTWDERGESSFQAGHATRKWSQHQVVCVHSLAAHVHRLYPPISRMLDEELTTEVLPLIRTAYQCALTAHWIAQTDDGVHAFVNHDVRERGKLAKTALEGVPEAVRGGSTIPGIDLEPLETSAAGPAGNFEQLCGELAPGGASAYFPYRVLSTYSHPSLALVDDYLEDGPSEEVRFTLRMTPKEKNVGAWRGMAVSCLVWSGRAVDFFDKTHARRSQLRRAARDLGIAPELKLSETANRRIAKARAKPKVADSGARPRR